MCDRPKGVLERERVAMIPCTFRRWPWLAGLSWKKTIPTGGLVGVAPLMHSLTKLSSTLFVECYFGMGLYTLDIVYWKFTYCLFHSCLVTCLYNFVVIFFLKTRLFTCSPCNLVFGCCGVEWVFYILHIFIDTLQTMFVLFCIIIIFICIINQCLAIILDVVWLQATGDSHRYDILYCFRKKWKIFIVSWFETLNIFFLLIFEIHSTHITS